MTSASSAMIAENSAAKNRRGRGRDLIPLALSFTATQAHTGEALIKFVGVSGNDRSDVASFHHDVLFLGITAFWRPDFANSNAADERHFDSPGRRAESRRIPTSIRCGLFFSRSQTIVVDSTSRAIASVSSGAILRCTCAVTALLHGAGVDVDEIQPAANSARHYSARGSRTIDGDYAIEDDGMG